MWGSGCQAFFHLECHENKAWLNISTQLGSPADCHFAPHVPTHQHHGFQGATQHHPHLPRKKGPAQKERDRACAAPHRAKLTEPEDTNLTKAVAADLSEQNKPPPAASPPPSPSPASQSPDPQSATLSEPHQPPPAPLPSFPRASVVSFTEVNDEVCQEQKEVKVHATGLFENCPDPCLNDEYFLSLQKFILTTFQMSRWSQSHPDRQAP